MGKALMIAHPVTGCWEWQAVLSNGYPNSQMHRKWWIASNGPIPKGMQLDHLCRNRCCVRPSHMEVVTPKENMRRGEALNMRLARMNQCINGHPLSGDNLYVTPGSGKRMCRICQRARQRAWRTEHPERVRAIAKRHLKKRRAGWRQWYAAHREQEAARHHRPEYLARRRARWAKWYAEHREEYLAQQRKAYRKRKRDAGGD